MAHHLNDNLAYSAAGVKLTKTSEGFSAKAYQDTGGVWTIGWGTTGPDAVPGRTCTKDEAQVWLRRDLIEAGDYVKKLVKVPLSQYQFDALVDFVYNIGPTKFAKSTLLRLLNRGNYIGAAGQFHRWVYGKNRQGKLIKLKGLVTRRLNTAELFMRDNEDPFTEEELQFGPTDIEKPEENTATVQGEAPEKHPNPIWDVITNSETFRTHVVSITGLVTAATALIEPLKNSPIALAALGIVGLGIAWAIVVKVRDTGEGR